MSIIGITMGCPAGIGPEIVLRYFSQRQHSEQIQPVVLGDVGILEKCGQELQLPAPCVSWQPGQPIPADCIPVMNLSTIPLKEHSWGKPNRITAKAMAGYIFTGVALLQEGVLDGITTCPISKSALQQAGCNYPGHTEMLVDLTGTAKYTMMMAGRTLKVTLATIHCALSTVPKSLTTEGIYDLIQITHSALQVDFGISRPRIGVAGLNPHSSEDGLFGNEEEQVIIPAVQQAEQAGLEVSGPYPPDTIFFKAAAGQFDGVVCMYHDQGLIPFKLLHFKDGVNVTLGLPIVRTSVDHGTAYDIAGRGLADSTSLKEAVDMAAAISKNRKSHKALQSTS